MTDEKNARTVTAAITRRGFMGLALAAASFSLAACGSSSRAGGEGSASASSSSSSDASSDASASSDAGDQPTGPYASGVHHATIEVTGYGTISVALNADVAPITV